MPKTQRSNDAPRWRTIGQITAEYPVSRPTIYIWIRRRQIISHLVPCTGPAGSGGKRLVDAESVERLIRSSPTKASNWVARRKAKAGHASAQVRWNGRRKR
jgi:hypothetical protein